jgi:Domain of unknown function DUF11
VASAPGPQRRAGPRRSTQRDAGLSGCSQREWRLSYVAQGALPKHGVLAPRVPDCINAALSLGELPEEKVQTKVCETYFMAVIIRNNGAREARASRLRVTMPAGLDFVNAEIERGGNWRYDDSTRRGVTVEIGRVGGGEPARVEMTLDHVSNGLLAGRGTESVRSPRPRAPKVTVTRSGEKE